MLKEIICEKIPNGRMGFQAGLNVVVGDESASNSIGKSSALLMIDFAFGGDLYAKRDDIVKNVGHHDVKIHFVFKQRDYFYLRNTAELNNVHLCDSDYIIKGTIRNADYKQQLYELYGVQTKPLKFGELMAQFCRVYGKNNYNERQPLDPGYSQSGEDRVVYLVQLFGYYNKIEEQNRVVKEAAERKKSYNKVVRLKLVSPVRTKKEYKEVIKDIDRLEKEATVIKARISSQTMNLTTEQLEQIGALKLRLSRIQNEIALINGSINRLNNNLKGAIDEVLVDISQIQSFFPSIEIKKIDEINQFHAKIASILRAEICERLEDEKNELKKLNQLENDIIERIKEVALKENPSDLALDRLVDTKQTIDSLIQGKASYELIQQLSIDYKDSKAMYDKILEDILARVSFDINKEMESLNKTILGEGKKAPLISLAPNKYSIKSEDDTGTGTNYRVLITFDLAVFNLTTLPVLIHDSLLFKNIDDDALDGILTLYESKTDKQVFISIDKVGSHGERVQDIVRRKKVLQISEENPFYGKSWKE